MDDFDDILLVGALVLAAYFISKQHTTAPSASNPAGGFNLGNIGSLLGAVGGTVRPATPTDDLGAGLDNSPGTGDNGDGGLLGLDLGGIGF